MIRAANISRIRNITGFTLIELALVVIVIGIVGVMVVIRWPGRGISLDAQAKALVNNIRYTQNLAMSRGARYKLVKISANGYRISTVADDDPTDFTLGPGASFGSFVNLPNNLIVFDGKGVPYIDAVVPGDPLTNVASIVLLGADGSTKSVTVSPETGRVSL